MDTFKNIYSEFSFNQMVFIQKGFYKGYYGTVEAYDTVSGQYTIKITANSSKLILCYPDDIRAMKSWLWMKW